MLVFSQWMADIEWWESLAPEQQALELKAGGRGLAVKQGLAQQDAQRAAMADEHRQRLDRAPALLEALRDDTLKLRLRPLQPEVVARLEETLGELCPHGTWGPVMTRDANAIALVREADMALIFARAMIENQQCEAFADLLLRSENADPEINERLASGSISAAFLRRFVQRERQLAGWDAEQETREDIDRQMREDSPKALRKLRSDIAKLSHASRPQQEAFYTWVTLRQPRLEWIVELDAQPYEDDLRACLGEPSDWPILGTLKDWYLGAMQKIEPDFTLKTGRPPSRIQRARLHNLNDKKGKAGGK
ncbi:hypothetical protein [Cupriavidus sp. PET2-C1]